MNALRKYSGWYALLLRLYPKSYRERFGEGIRQTFNDLLRERAREERGLFGFALWMFLETSVGIVRENTRHMTIQHKNIVCIVLGTAGLLLIPLVAMQFTDEVSWGQGDFIIMGALLLAVGFTYEFIAKRTNKTVYRVAFAVGLGAAFLLAWVNGAVGIIGNEGQPANLLYAAVFAAGLVGSLVARFKPRGMALTLFAAAAIQLLVPVAAMLAWPNVSWGAAGMFRVFVFNAFFAVLFVVSAVLFRRAATDTPQPAAQS